MEITIKVKNYETKISQETLNQEVFDVDFGGDLLLQIMKTKDGLKVTNGINGWGYNVQTEFENEPVIIF